MQGMPTDKKNSSPLCLDAGNCEGQRRVHASSSQLSRCPAPAASNVEGIFPEVVRVLAGCARAAKNSILRRVPPRLRKPPCTMFSVHQSDRKSVV